MRHSPTTIAIRALALAALAAFVTAAGAGRAQDSYPSKPIRIVLPQPAGGAVDMIARTLGDRLQEQMGQPVIVDNQPGASGALAARQVARATPDGYTLFLAVDNNLVINPHLYSNLAYDPFRDFVPIGVVARVSMVLVASTKVPASNVRELIDYAKANPASSTTRRSGSGRSRISAWSCSSS
jgi:tripartite-type tricarboxylate transporter receptor subunit TctC